MILNAEGRTRWKIVPPQSVFATSSARLRQSAADDGERRPGKSMMSRHRGSAAVKVKACNVRSADTARFIDMYEVASFRLVKSDSW